MKMQFSHIQRTSYVDGPGRRTVLFMQGCQIHCPGCQNKHLWPSNGGHEADTDTIASIMSLCLAKDGGRAVTISGGEPFAQPGALVALLERLRFYGVQDILVYSGYTFEELEAFASPDNNRALRMIDTLVDGRFIAEQDDPLIAWRGSRNQRAIAVQVTLETGLVVRRDWSRPTAIITTSGEVLFPVGLSKIMPTSTTHTRRCGETRN